MSGARHTPAAVTTLADLALPPIRALLARFGLRLELVAGDAAIPGSFWGAPEAGIVGRTVTARPDTPLHSVLHEACHLICMDPARRRTARTDAGGDDLEEAAVCYLQIVLAEHIDRVQRAKLMRDMDAWGYSFRLGSSRRWFDCDAGDARDWLCRHGLLSTAGEPTFECRKR